MLHVGWRAQARSSDVRFVIDINLQQKSMHLTEAMCVRLLTKILSRCLSAEDRARKLKMLQLPYKAHHRYHQALNLSLICPANLEAWQQGLGS